MLEVRNSFHESFQREESIQPGSDRAYGLLFCVVFAIVAAWPLLDGGPPALWAVVVAAALLAISFLAPGLLRPANRLWLKLGLALAHVVSPVALALLYYGAFVPTALLMRLLGKDPLRRSFDRGAKSYWIERAGAPQEKQDMRNQF